MKIAVFALLCAVGFAGVTSAQDTMPEGPGKEQTLRLCSTCHEAAKATSVKLTRDGWIETIDRMKAFGAAGADDEFAAVLEYLATHFKGETVRPLDMNTAEAIDLESVLQLLRRESKAVLDYRSHAREVLIARRPEGPRPRHLQENRSEKGSHRLPDATVKGSGGVFARIDENPSRPLFQPGIRNTAPGSCIKRERSFNAYRIGAHRRQGGAAEVDGNITRDRGPLARHTAEI